MISVVPGVICYFDGKPNENSKFYVNVGFVLLITLRYTFSSHELHSIILYYRIHKSSTKNT